jgi:hypothetical protein
MPRDEAEQGSAERARHRKAGGQGSGESRGSGEVARFLEEVDRHGRDS